MAATVVPAPLQASTLQPPVSDVNELEQQRPFSPSAIDRFVRILRNTAAGNTGSQNDSLAAVSSGSESEGGTASRRTGGRRAKRRSNTVAGANNPSSKAARPPASSFLAPRTSGASSRSGSGSSPQLRGMTRQRSRTEAGRSARNSEDSTSSYAGGIGEASMTFLYSYCSSRYVH